MPQGVATERVATQQRDVDSEHDGAHAHAELHAAHAIREPQRFPHVVRQKYQKEQRQVEEVAMDVLHDQREGPLATIMLAWFAHGAGRWIGPESLVVRAAVVVASEPEAGG